MNLVRLRASLLGGAALCAIATFTLVAAAKLYKTGSSSAGFRAQGPAGMTITGTTSDLTVSDDGTTVTVTIPLATSRRGSAFATSTRSNTSTWRPSLPPS